MSTPYVGIESLMLYLNNESPHDLFSRLFPESSDDYVSEWMGRLRRRGANEVWAHLDNLHRRRLIDHALEKYGGEALARDLMHQEIVERAARLGGR